MKWIEHELSINASSMARWRKRIGEAGAEKLLKEIIKAGLKLKAVKYFQLKRVNIDSTVQEKEICFSTDARLYDRSRQRIVDFAKRTRDLASPKLQPQIKANVLLTKSPLSCSSDKKGPGLYSQVEKLPWASAS
jgi:IS5 family transposase